MFGELQEAETRSNPKHSEIAQSDLGGAGLWLRAEAGDDPKQAEALAEMVARAIGHEAPAS